jgi:hypothetical protein
MAAPPSDPRVEDLRQRLRSLGYLDAGVDRFVLGPAHGTRGPSAVALLGALRIGILAALLLGPAVAIGLSSRLPSLIVGPRDAVLVAIYLGVFFAAAMTIAAAAANLLVAGLARRASSSLAPRHRLLSRTAGAIVSIGCLAYLTLWWQNAIEGVGWSAPLWTLSALAVAVAISLVLGHAVTVSSAAVIVAGAGPHAQPAPLASWRTSLLAAVVAFGGAALLLTWSSGFARAAEPTPPAITVVPSGLRVRVFAIDGFDPSVFSELSAAGRVPSLTATFRGATARLDRHQDTVGDPARVWTTVATGQPPEVHGVQGLETRRVAGVQGSVPAIEQSPLARAMRGATDLVRLTRPAIASGSERRSKTFWEVAAEAGLRTVVVNWWATWPAPAANAGIVLSDRATLRLEHGGPLDAEISPERLYEPLRERWTALTARATALAVDALRDPIDAASRPLLQRSAELDALQLALASEVVTPDTDLSVVYLPGLDIAQHALLGGDQSGVVASASAIGARLDALKAYYAALDRLLSALLAVAPDDLVILVTEPGRVSAEAGARLAARGQVIRDATTIDAAQTAVAPTILHALGVPVAKDLASAPLADLFSDGFRARYPVRTVATYGESSARSGPNRGRPLDQEMIDRLRSLGYVR